MEVPGVMEVDAAPVKGHDKKNVASLVNLHNTLYEPVHIIARGHFRYKDHGMDWQLQERGNHAVLTHFDWTVEATS